MLKKNKKTLAGKKSQKMFFFFFKYKIENKLAKSKKKNIIFHSQQKNVLPKKTRSLRNTKLRRSSNLTL